MILQVLALYDKKARAFKMPWFSAHLDLAVRALRDAVNNAKESDVCKFPEDFALYQLGTWNDENGLFDLKAQPGHVAEALQLKKEANDV